MSAASVIIGLAAAVLIGAPPATADEVADFYNGKNLSLFVGYPPGGGYDVYARLIARTMTKHMPGHPQFTVRHKPGGPSADTLKQLHHAPGSAK